MINKIFLLSRPRFWLYVLGPYLYGVIAGGTIAEFSQITILYGLFYFLIPANLFIYTINDYFDQNIDQLNPKKNKKEIIMNTNDKHLYLIIIFFSLLLALPLLFYGTLPMLAVLLFLFIGYFYSSPPLRFKTKPILDSASNFFYILPGVFSYSYLTGSLPPIQILIAGSLWTMAMHLFSAIVDISSDKKSGITTTAIVVGYRNSLVLTSILWGLSVLLVLPYSPLLLIGVVYPLLPLIVLRRQYPISKAYWLFPWINTLIGFSIFCLLLFYV